MNTEKQRIAIAEACGWKRTGANDHTSPKHITLNVSEDGGPVHSRKAITWESKGPHERLEAPDGSGSYFLCGCDNTAELPDYLNDLNACHEMEKVMTRDQVYEYWVLLSDQSSIPRSVLSPAPERCESFLRTIGKWEDE